MELRFGGPDVIANNSMRNKRTYQKIKLKHVAAT